MAIRIAKLFVEVGAETREAEQGLRRVDSELHNVANSATRNSATFGTGMEGMRSQLGQVATEATRVGAILTAGLTFPLVAVGREAYRLATGYESAMNLFQATSEATVGQMAQVADAAKALGNDMSLPGTSAADAALAMTELVKAGMSVDDVLGAAKGTLQLSAAGQLANARAAEITANALNSFSLEGTEAIRVADLLAAAANASSAEVLDIADSLKMASAVASAAGVPIEDLTAQIGLMANSGIKGSDAGTSLKSMLLALQAPTDKARGLMRQLGIDIYDANGNMYESRELIAQFTTALGALTQEQRDAALATIFGSDGIRAANVVLMGGVEAWDAMKEAVTREGVAATLAATRMKGLGGAVEGLKSVTETFLLNAVEPFLGMMENLVRGLAGGVEWLGQLDRSLINAGLAFAVVLALAGPLIAGVGMLAGALAFLLSPIGLVVAAASTLAALFAGDIGGIRSRAIAGLLTLQATFQQVADAIQPVISILQTAWTNVQQGQSPLEALLNTLAALTLHFGGSIEQAVGFRTAVQGILDILVGGTEPLGDWSYWWERIAGLLGGETADALVGAGEFLYDLRRAVLGVVEVARLLATGDFRGGIFGLDEDDPAIATLFTVRNALLELANIAGQTARSVGSALAGGDLSGAFQALVGGAGQAGAIFGELWTALEPYVIAFGKLLVARAQEWGKALLGWVRARIPLVQAELQELGAAVWAWLQGRAGALGQVVQGWGSQLVGWVRPRIPVMLTELQELQGRLFAWIQEKAGELGGRFVAWRDAFVGWIVPATVSFLQQWPGMFDRFLIWIESQAGPLLAKLGTWALQFIAWVGPMIPNLLLAAGAVSLALMTWVAETAVVLGGHLLKWAAAFLGWVATDVLPTLWDVLWKIGTRIAEWIAVAAPWLNDHLKLWAVAFLDWIQNDVSPFLAERLQAISDGIAAWVQEKADWVVDEAAKIGRAMVDGLRKGIRDQWDSLLAWLNEQIAKLPEGVKKFLGIASPSRLFAEEVGAPIAQGIAAGIQRNIGLATAAARRAALETAQAAQGAMGQQRLAPAPVGATPLGGAPAPLASAAPTASATGGGEVVKLEVHLHVGELRTELDLEATAQRLVRPVAELLSRKQVAVRHG